MKKHGGKTYNGYAFAAKFFGCGRAPACRSLFFALLHLGIRRRLHAGKWETQCMECESQYTENYSTTANGVSQYLPASTLTALKLKISLVNS